MMVVIVEPRSAWVILCNIDVEYYAIHEEDEPVECPNGHTDIVVIGRLVPVSSAVSPDDTTWETYIDNNGATINAKRWS